MNTQKPQTPLSEKVIVFKKGQNIVNVKDYCPVIHKKEVTSSLNNFIRRLKEECEDDVELWSNPCLRLKIYDIIDKTASKHFGDLVGDKK